MDQKQNTDTKENNNEEIKKRYKALINKWGNFTSGNKAYFRLTPILLVVIALPLVVLMSIQQQEIRQKAAESVNCNTGLTCGACEANPNTCGFGNGKQICVYRNYANGQACNPVTIKNVFCHVSNCSVGFACLNQKCVSKGPPQIK